MLIATGSRYIIKANELAKQTAGGIIVNYTGETQFATIVSIGPKVKDPVSVGSVVAVEWNHTIPLKDEDKDYFVIEERSVMAVIE